MSLSSPAAAAAAAVRELLGELLAEVLPAACLRAAGNDAAASAGRGDVVLVGLPTVPVADLTRTAAGGCGLGDAGGERAAGDAAPAAATTSRLLRVRGELPAEAASATVGLEGLEGMLLDDAPARLAVPDALALAPRWLRDGSLLASCFWL